jgi:hypothetical protein
MTTEAFPATNFIDNACEYETGGSGVHDRGKESPITDAAHRQKTRDLKCVFNDLAGFRRLRFSCLFADQRLKTQI